MTPPHGPPTLYRPADYHAVAGRFGYRYKRLLLEPEGREAEAECALFTGRVEVEEPQPGLVITRSDVVQLHEARAEAEMSPGLMVGVVLAGAAEGWIDGAGAVALPAGAAMTLRMDRAIGFSGRLPPGRRQCMVTVFARPDWLATHGLDQALARGDAPGFALRQWAPSPALGLRVAQLMRLEASVPAMRLIEEAAALDLLAEAVGRLSPDLPADGRLRPPDLARMIRLRDRLLAEPDADYTLAGLAREAGVSVTLLKDHFRRAFGGSPFEFLRALRLERARSLIEQGWTVAQAAYYAGYRHPSNFATAFRRRFGTAPRALRR